MGEAKRVMNLIPLMLLWLVLSVIIWGWVFGLLTDTDRAHKLTLYVDGEVKDGVGLAVALERELKGEVRMVQVRPFTYAMMNEGDIRAADLYILPDADLPSYGEWLRQPGEPLAGSGAPWLALDKAGNWRLYIGASTLHGAETDGLAETAAGLLLRLLAQEDPA